LQKEVKKGVNISVITQIEVFSWEFPTFEMETTMKIFIYGTTIYKLTREVVYKTIEIRKGRKLKLPDAVIAATALVHDFTLVSKNDKDFKKIPNLKYLNPFTDL
jgi:predicted nucleic acid-binding protein